MIDVNKLCEATFGLSVNDGADFPSYDLWESGVSPKRGLEVWCEWQDIDPSDFL